jgi:hypothetical protein
VLLAKGFYARLRTEADGSVSTEGGRVTELVARPVLGLWWPHLAGVVPGLAFEQFDREDGQVRRRTRPVAADERPPAGTVPAAGPAGWPPMLNAAP